ncbi:ATP-binding cassette domain-containing protein, partial [bacterium]|nr:ATP-binding cassette domain-containing protein [bacterium]
MDAFLAGEEERVAEIAVYGGYDKGGEPEPVSELSARLGEVICIVGPTGSGKSRLLADIEWVARGDTPTGRRVTINGREAGMKWRTSSEHKLVAQLSQNMNFVMDLSVADFLALHADSRQAPDPEAKIQRIWKDANALAGEPFAHTHQKVQ